MFLLWAIAFCIWVSPIYVGIGLVCLTEILMYLCFVYIGSWSPLELGKS